MYKRIRVVSQNTKLERVYSSWDVQCPEAIRSTAGSCVLIPCSFNYPSDITPPKGIVPIWYKNLDGERNVVYHPTNTIDDRFLGRVEFLGDTAEKNCTLLIKKVRMDDTGLYNFRFEIRELNAWVHKRGVQITVTESPLLPDVVIPPHISEGASVTFKCTTQYFCPDGSVTLEWQNYVSERSFLSRHVHQDTSKVLMEKDLTSSFTWQENKKIIGCALSIGTKKVVKEVILNVTHSPKEVEVVIRPSTDNIKQGTSVTLSCQTNGSNPAIYSYTWYKNDILISTEELISFHSVSRNDFGEYRCEVQNVIGKTVSQTVRLVVFSAWTLVSPSSQVREGETVTLTCDVPGARPDEIHYSWFKNNVWIKEGSVRSLVFHEVAWTDTGYYFCRVQNDKGTDSSPPITMNVLYPPRNPSLTSFLETQQGKLAIIHCTVDSNPLSEVMLYKDRHLVATTTSHGAPTQRLRVVSTRNSLVLEIQSVTLSDEGTYSCLAKNTIGNSTSSLHFTVETARVIIIPAPEIEEGREVTLTCLALQNSQKGSTYTWHKNSKLLKEESEDNTLSFRHLSRTDAGSYYCRAQNSEGTSSSPPSTLHVLFAPSDLTLTSFVTTHGRILGIIQCTVASDPLSDLFIYRKDTLVASSAMVSVGKKYNLSHSTNSLKLEIQDVLLEDEGTYLCFANNTYGQTTGSLDFTAETVNIVVSPSLEVLDGESVNLTCGVKSALDGVSYAYSWYKNTALYLESQEEWIAFPQVTSSDSGSYYCKVRYNENHKDSSSVSLSVKYAPRHIQLKSFLDTEEGKVASIQCSVDSYSASHMYLYLKDQLVASNVNRTSICQRYSASFSRNQLSLDIKYVKLEDDGIYTCTSRNDMGSVSESIYFRVQTARVLVSPSKEISEGDTVTLTCDMMRTQIEELTYVWYKNSKRVSEATDKSLVFNKVDGSDAGYYHCKAQDSQESSVAPSVSLHVSYAPRKPVISSLLDNQSGQSGVIQCSVDSEPPSTLSLFRRETLVGSTDSHASSNQRLTIFSSPNSLKLEIRDVMLEDEGLYLCIANNSAGQSASSINFTAQTTRILIHPSPRVPEGQMVNLTCAVATDARLGARYTWHKNGKLYRESSAATLQYDVISREDEGSYYCAVQNHHGTKSSPSVMLNVLYGPENVYIRSFVETQNGRMVIILCGALSNPPSEIALYKDGKLLASSTGGSVSREQTQAYFSSDTLRLEMTNIMSSDQGTYVCVANNSYGSKQVSTSVTVEGARVLMSPSMGLREGHSVTLTCEVLDGPQTVTGYTWYKDSRWFQGGLVGSLVLDHLSSSDSGSYYCTAHKSEGLLTSPPTILRVLYPPRNLSITSFFETQERRLGVIMCSVDSQPPSSLTMHHGNQALVPSIENSSSRLKLSASHNSLKLELAEITAGNQGLYVCRANNSLGIAESSIHFSVQTAGVVVYPSAELREGESVTLTCRVPSQGNLTYTWYKNNKWLTEGEGASLVLAGVTSTDTGSYHCVTKHRSGSSISPHAGITVLYGPRNLVITSFLETHGRKLAIITCIADSNPQSSLSLYRREVLLTSTPLTQADQGQKLWSSSSNNYLRLEIRDVTAEDSGSYKCVANNTLGTASSSSIVFNMKNGEFLVYKTITWVAIICIVILVSAIAGIIYCTRMKGKYHWQTDRDSIEMNNKETSQSPAIFGQRRRTPCSSLHSAAIQAEDLIQPSPGINRGVKKVSSN
ncbi:sialoadhesin [Pelodytes ibericus]